MESNFSFSLTFLQSIDQMKNYKSWNKNKEIRLKNAEMNHTQVISEAVHVRGVTDLY